MFNCCVVCNVASTRKFCSDACKWRGAKKLKCVDCGCDTGWRHTDKRAGKSPRCKSCLRGFQSPKEHGTRSMYQVGKCRCELCNAANAESMRVYALEFRRLHGYSLSSKYRNTSGNVKHAGVPMKIKRAVYERDQWICQLCHRPVDRSLHFNDRWAATVDHIECQSWVLIPDNSMRNLRLAHRTCNSRRRNRKDVDSGVA